MNKLTTAVWEITMGCNMRCKHCGSSCAEALPDELNTSEALEVCDQLKDLGLKVIMPLSTNLFAIICQSLRVVGSPPDNVITFNPKSFNWSHTSSATR